MRTRNEKGLPDFREASDRDFDAALTKRRQGVPVKDLTDQELWILYTKWDQADCQCGGRSPYAIGLRASASRYRRDLKSECVRRGILRPERPLSHGS